MAVAAPKRSWLVLLLLLASPAPSAQAKWRYFRTGHAEDSHAAPRAGFALMGGGTKQDAAFRFLCERANGGDFLILRANSDATTAKQLNAKVRGLCSLNSAATIIFNDREDSDDPRVVQIIDQAESIFIAGGDQSNYLRFWQDTPVQDALNRHIAAGKPIGGSSAGLAILGEFSFASIIDTIHSPEALADPYGNKVTLSRDFLRIPLLQGTITDTHFVKRDRLGRLLVFMARILEDGWAQKVRAIAVEEDAAVLLEPDGSTTVAGAGPAYFLEAANAPTMCKRKTPLTMGPIAVHRAPAGAEFNVRTWSGTGGDDYTLSVDAGRVVVSGSAHGVY
ncbi:MAG TPA: cyanophycinase [Methylomirabilota bacterium]|nr:cyanophycinase [Methylomirabilota bacterium]